MVVAIPRSSARSTGRSQLAILSATGMNAPRETCTKFLQSQEVRPSGVVLRDYNYNQPIA